MQNLKDGIFEDISLIEYIKRSGKSVVLYGMGDGAVKLLSILNSHGIVPVGIFASDEFVRYNKFCSYTVKKLSDIEAEFDDFIILVAFATSLDSVRNHIFSLSERHPIFVPDINVAGDPLEIFDTSFYNENYERLNLVYSRLDTRSKEVFSTLINFKISGKIEYLKRLEELRLEEKIPYDTKKITSFADLGAYTGDTLKEAVSLYPNLKKAICFEPDNKSFKKLETTALSLCVDTTLINGAAHLENTTLEIFEGASRNTILQDNAFESSLLQKKKVREIKAFRPDKTSSFIPDLIKMDVEGSEISALEGCRGFFEKASPVMRISIYHNNRDLFEIFEKIEEIKKGYKFSLSQKCAYIPAWDIELVAYN